MDEPIIKLTEEHRQRIEEFRAQHRTGVLTLLFTDVVDSTALKHDLGDTSGNALLTEHQKIVRNLRSQFKESEEIHTAGDSFFIVFTRPSDSVRFALLLQSAIRTLNSAFPRPLALRIGIHMGEVFIEKQGDSKIQDILGIQVDTASRVMSLAKGQQILLTRSVFDNARIVLRGEEITKVSKLSWMSHGPYRIKGIEELLEICEVGEEGLALLSPPTDSEKAQRFISSEAEPVLGWRPAIEQIIPGTEWVLEEKLGEGGFGEVWLARHKTMKNKRVFKFCFRADRVRSLKREVAIFRLLKEKVGEHPNIVRLYDVYFDNPPFYIAMEYVEGKNLMDWFSEQGGVDKVPLKTRLEIVAQVADALQAAHDSGVIHRDIKPSNILITETGSTIKARLTDFGIGQVISKEILAQITTTAGFAEIMQATELSSRTGTRLYMAPEVIAGKTSTTRSDIYSLGVVLYQLVLGDLIRPLTTDWRNYIADRILAQDFTRCFAGNPTERFSSASQLAESLRSFESRRIALVKHERAVRRKKVSLALALSAFIILLLVGTFYSINRISQNYLSAAFIAAAENGDKAKVEDLLKKGVDVNTENKNGDTALIRVIKNRRESMFNTLLKKGAAVNTKDIHGNTPLMYAVIGDSDDFEKRLLDQNANVNAKNNNGETALMFAAFSGFTGSFSMLKNSGSILYTGDTNQDLLIAAADGDTTKVKELLDKKADINTENSNGDTAQILAARNRKNDAVQYLRNVGATPYYGDVNKNLLHAALFGDTTVIQQCFDKGADVNTRDFNGDTPLIIAVKYRHNAIVPFLLNNKEININAKNKYGITALMIASVRDDQPTVQTLLNKGAEINAQDDFHRTAFFYAASFQTDTAILQALFRNQADINIKANDDMTPIISDAMNGYTNIAKFLLDRGADVNVKDVSGATPLWWAVARNHTVIALALLDKGAAPSLKGPEESIYSGMTPLMLAAKNGNKKIVLALLGKKVDVNLKTPNGFTALMFAAQYTACNVSTMEILLDNGAEVNAKNRWCTSLHFAAQTGQTDKVKVLLDKGAEVDATDYNGYTPLMYAADVGYMEIVQLLLKKAANVNLKENRGWTPLMFAANKGYVAIVKLLLEKSAMVNQKNNEGDTALMLANEMDYPDIVEMLKKYAAKE
jgi:ankyrin repeat protein/class 3 adenylate cyclase/tRNA A-37 threonylcarbamoyl transferase component Bud32